MKFGSWNYLFFLWVIPVMVVFYVYAFRKRDKMLALFCGKELVGELVPDFKKGRRLIKALLILMGIILGIFALTRPQWGFHWEEIKRVGVDVMVAIDVSESMLAEDVKPNRLERAKREVIDLIEMLEGDRIGLIAFAGTSFVQCPLTLDYGACKMFLDYIDTDLIPVPGTAIAEAIRTSLKSFNKRERKSKALILITDGEDHEGEPIDAAKEAKKEGIKIFTIGVGREGGAPIPLKDGSGGFKKDRKGDMIITHLDEITLQKIALETGGSYVRSVTGDMDLDKIYQEGIKQHVEQKQLKSTRKRRWEERFQWFIFFALLFVSVEFFVSERRAVLS
ncbi:MAG: VWA domain-containing protein [Deltaproteobacteria bacterium]|jgi:Ca-activated chloride channel family protein|nr:VWA domain-containing protein [Deltaproteobacteria bacterium]